MATFINIASSGSYSWGTVTVNSDSTDVSFNNSGGNFTFGSVNVRLNVFFNGTTNANFTISSSTFNRQTEFKLKQVTKQTLNLTGITSYSTDSDTFNLNIEGSKTNSTITVTNTDIYATNNNDPINSTLDITFTNTNIYLAYYSDAAEQNNFSYGLQNSTMCNQCNFYVGYNTGTVNVAVAEIFSRIPNMNIVGNVVMVDSIFKRELITTVSAGKTLTFSRCEFYEFTNPQIKTIFDNTLFTLKGNTGSVFFENSTVYPRVSQSKSEGSERIFGISNSATYSQMNSDSTLLIHHLPSVYNTFDTLYNNVAVVKHSTVEVDVGDYVFGTETTDPITFDFNVHTSQTDPTTNVTVYINGGNVTYTKDDEASDINWSGYIIGRNNQDGGRTYAFTASSAFNISGGLIITANAGNNILDPSATQGTWTGDTWFSYYPNTTVDYSYNLMLENSLIVGTTSLPTPIPLYNGINTTYNYDFYADSTYRPNFYLGRANDARFDLSAGSAFGLRLNLKNCEFHRGVDLTIGGDEYVLSDGSKYYTQVGSTSCIALSGAGTFDLHTGTAENDLYLRNDEDLVINNGGITTVTVNYNKYHFESGTWNFNATGLTTYKAYISSANNGADDITGRKGTICLDGSYTFTNVPDYELNFLTEGNSTVGNTTFTQTIYVWGSNELTLNNNTFEGLTTAHYDLNPANVTPSSVVGTELVNLSSYSGARVFGGLFYLVNTNNFHLPHGKKCVYPYGPVDTVDSATKVILTSYRYSYFITSSAEPLAYNLGVVYLDNAPSNDTTVFGADASTAVDKEFTIRTIGTSSDQYITGRFSRLNLQTESTQKVILGYPQALIGRSTESNLKILYVNGNNDTYALDIQGGTTADVQIENVTFVSPGSFAYFHVGTGANNRIDFSSTTNAFNNDDSQSTKHVGYIQSSGANAILDLGDETFPGVGVVPYNAFFWPTLGNVSSSPSLISTQGYVAESWTNDPDYYDPEAESPEMYFVNQTGGLGKPTHNNENYGLYTWDAGENVYNDLYFYVAFGLTGTNTFEVSLNHVANFESYVAGAIYDTNTTGVNTKTYSNTQYRGTIRLRFRDNFDNLAQTSRYVVGTFNQGGSDLWSYAPVPLTYFISSLVDVNNYTLSTQFSTNGGSSWLDVSGPTDIRVSEYDPNGTANVRFLFQNNEDTLRFLYDTSLTFAVDISFISVLPDPDVELNEYTLSWPSLSYDSNHLELKPLPYAGAWTQKSVLTTHTSNNTATFYVNNVDYNDYLLVSDTSAFTGANNLLTITPTIDASYNVNSDTYSFTTDFYLMTPVLPPAGTGFDPLVLDVSCYVDGQTIYPTATVDVSGTGTSQISLSDTPTPVHVSFALDNSSLLSADTSFTVTLILNDVRNQSGPVLVNPINNPATITLSFYVPLYVYLNTSDSRYNIDINENVSKGVTNNLYVYLNTKLSYNYDINFSLTGDNINFSIPVTIANGDISANGSFNISEDNKIWGDAALTLTADVSLVNTINYTYNEASTHEVRVLFGRAIQSGYESSGANLSTMQYSIQAATGEESDRTPTAWNQGDAAGAAYDITQSNNASFLPISKYTPYFVEVEVKSKGFNASNINTDLIPSFSLQLTDYMGANLTEGTDYIVNNVLSKVNGTNSINMIDLINDTSVNQRLYFRLNPVADLDGDVLGVKVVFNTDASSNYVNLGGNYHIANVNYTGAYGNMSSTNYLDSAGIRTNTWRIQPSGDGKFLEFYHDDFSANSPSYVTRLGIDGSFNTPQI
jgi:hypothetical protein